MNKNYSEIKKRLEAILDPESFLHKEEEIIAFECDALTYYRVRPVFVVLPSTAEQVSEIIKVCYEFNMPFVPRGAGTGLSGGALPVDDGVLISLAKMNQILEIDIPNRLVVVQPGVINRSVSEAVDSFGYYYAPDPSSQIVCTIGGNVATNSGGPHTLKYGVTVNHVLGLELVLADGRIVQVGGPAPDAPGLDLVGTIVGSEGTLAIATRVWVRITHNPQGYRTMLGIFESVGDATNAISAIIAAGIVPAALEMMDGGIVVALEEAFKFGFPLDAGAILLMEVDGIEAGLDEQRDQIVVLCEQHGAREVREACDSVERQKLWKCRKQAFGAIGRLSPSYCTQDGVVPRSKLPHMMQRITEIGAKHDVRIVNVFHAGDGNLHPIVLFDERDAAQMKRVLAASDEILEECLSCGGSVTGEHGIGVEKVNFMRRMFNENDLATMRRLRIAFNPRNLLSPHKMLPTAGACGIEQRHPGRRAAL